MNEFSYGTPSIQGSPKFQETTESGVGALVNGFFIDTKVLSETFRKTPDERVADCLRSADSDFLFAGALVLAEIRFGIELLDHGKRRLELKRWFEGKLKVGVKRFV